MHTILFNLNRPHCNTINIFSRGKDSFVHSNHSNALHCIAQYYAWLRGMPHEITENHTTKFQSQHCDIHDDIVGWCWNVIMQSLMRMSVHRNFFFPKEQKVVTKEWEKEKNSLAVYIKCTFNIHSMNIQRFFYAMQRKQVALIYDHAIISILIHCFSVAAANGAYNWN